MPLKPIRGCRIFLNETGISRKIMSIVFEKDGSIYIDFSAYSTKSYTFGHLSFPRGNMGPVDLSLAESTIKKEGVPVAPKMTFHASGMCGINKHGLLGYLFPPIWITSDPLREIDGHLFTLMAVNPRRFALDETTRKTDFEFTTTNELDSFKIVGYLNSSLDVRSPDFDPLKQVYTNLLLPNKKQNRNNHAIAIKNWKLGKWLLLEFQPNSINGSPLGTLAFWFGWKRFEILNKNASPSFLAVMSEENR